MQERYGITEEDAYGEVLWHSLNESGEIDSYDMKFGTTIIRNLSEDDLDEKKKKKRTHEHKIREADDPNRKSKK